MQRLQRARAEGNCAKREEITMSSDWNTWQRDLVSMRFAGTGIGDVLDDRVLASQIIDLIVDRAQLTNLGE